MRKIVTILALAIAMTACCQQPTEKLTILSYNIRNGIGLDDIRNHNRTSGVIRRSEADVVALQEVDSMTARSGYASILDTIASKTAFVPSFAKAIDYDGGAYGIGMLSKQKPLKTIRISLPGREEERVLLISEFEKYVFCATHFSLTPDDQLTSIKVLDSATRHYQKPVFVAGDLNFQPTDEQFRRLSKSFSILSPTTQATYPANSPTECIDYIAVRKADSSRVSIISSEIIDAPIESDHRPLRVILTIK